jgi:hypothetical protein
LDGTLEGMRGKISKDTMEELERNYDKKTVDAIVEALVGFEPYLEPADGLTSSFLADIKKKRDDLKKLARNTIKAVDFLLERAFALQDIQRGILQSIKADNENLLKFFSPSYTERVVLDPLKEYMLNAGASRTLLDTKPEGWTDAYYERLVMGRIAFVKPPGKKRLFLKTLINTIFRLLENKDKQIKWRHNLTVDIMNQCVKQHLKKELTTKDIDNALHSS